MQQQPWSLSSLAVPGVLTLVSFLAYSSQYLFLSLEPHPLTRKQTAVFNILVICLLLCYARACLTDPGRVTKGWTPETSTDEDVPISTASDGALTKGRQRWCRKCEAAKPPRAHHCKVCNRCVLKMDHHCPWTVNCVSHITFPHFIRFLFYAVAAMAYLEYFLYVRAAILWKDRKMPSYLGPSPAQLIHLFVLVVANSITLFALSILLVQSVWGLASNTTTIERWEIERHEALLRRARHLGGYLDGPDGQRVRIFRQEFPYDIGIWQNVKQGMGSGNARCPAVGLMY